MFDETCLTAWRVPIHVQTCLSNISLFQESVMDGPTALALALALQRKTKQKKRKWAKNWFLQRKEFGHSKLLDELRCTEPSDFRIFLRMNEDSFDELLELVRPFIIKQDTNMRDAISPADKLSEFLFEIVFCGLGIPLFVFQQQSVICSFFFLSRSLYSLLFTFHSSGKPW